MKKLALLVLGFGFGFIVCTQFFCKTEVVIDDETVEDPKPPSGYIEPGDMKLLSDGYNTRHAIINKALGITDNRSSWYSLNDMRQFLDYAEFRASNTNYPMDGVRIYMGANDGGQGLATLFLVPTSSAIKTNSVKSKGSVFNLNFSAQTGGGDIPGIGGLDYGGEGDPPGQGYPNPNN